MLVFIGYRRDDSAGHAGRLYDRLIAALGAEQVYRDLESIDAGSDFVEAVRQKVERCDVLLAVIGERWLTATDADGRWRLADEQDLVRVEIATALRRNARVIPVLVQGAAMPRAQDLPGELAALSRRNAVQIRDSHFDHDTDELIRLLAPGWRDRWVWWFGRRPLRVAAAIAALAVVAVLVGVFGTGLRPSPEAAREQLGRMGLQYDANTFVERVRREDAVAVELFLKAGMSPDTRGGTEGAAATEYAAYTGNERLMRMLVDAGADIAVALRAAARHGASPMVADLLNRKPTSEALDGALIDAAGTGRAAIVETLLDRGARLGARGTDGETVLAYAAGAGDPATVTLLLARGADASATFDGGKSALHEVLDRGASDDDGAVTEIAKALLDKGAPFEARARYNATEQPTPLLHAIQRDHARAALLLLERGADAKAQMTLDGTIAPVNALMLAAHEGLDGLIPVLVAKGLDVNARNADVESAMTRAFGTTRDAAGTVRALLQAGADQAPGQKGVTPLMLAASAVNGVESLRLLISAGSAVDARDSLGMTALMYAAAFGRADAVPLLLAAGADRAARNADGQTALALATKAGFERTVEALGR